MTHELVRTIPSMARRETRTQSDMVDQIRADHRAAAHAMTPSPFARDVGERAGKTLAYTFANYLFGEWLGTLVALTITDRAGIFATGMTVCSVAGSLISRRFGVPGTASLTKVVDYGSPPSR